MLYTEDSLIDALAVHVVGNKAKDEPLMLSPALSDQVGDDGLMQTLLAYFMSGFKSEEYFNLYHESDLACNEVYNFAGRIFDDPESFYENSVSLAKHLYETGIHPQIKSGEFYVVYFSGCRFAGEQVDAVGLFKSETRDTFLDVEKQGEGLHIASHLGININKLDKGCLVFNTEREAGFAVCVVDNTNRTEARYWIDDFLHVRQRQDNYHNTHNAMAMCKKYVTKHLPSEFDVSRADQAEMLNETMKYFKEQGSFSMDEFSERVIRQPEVMESFSRYKQEYEQDRDIRIEDEFAISDSAVKKQARAYKSVIKLDRNFHIYVHGNRSLIEQGEDSKGKFYKVYYENEE
ncbi:nucleoid-associated protein [uncultured Alistipes sp.]|jgi:hypothetical protein|uniref:nucleoid-associated protein n=1 Tax=uncultured Alistipes sp. TaxID=538949 RepID=UPI0025FDEFC2|nr:nucleoid-associated protein [uncultured Alistipes sp.]